MNDVGKVAVRGYAPGDAPRVVELYETCFGSARTIEDWRWRYEDVPNRVDRRVLTIDDRVMGFVGRRWFDVWVQCRRARCFSGGDLMIDPDIRGRGLTRVLLDLPTTSWPDLSFGFPRRTDLSAHEQGGEVLTADGALPQWVRWHAGSAVHTDATWIPTFVGALGADALRLRSVVWGRSRRRRAVVDVDLDSFDDWAHAFDDLALASREFATAVMVRDARYLRWRWLERPGAAWHMTVAPSPDGSGIDGYVVYGERAEQGRIVDLLATDATAMHSLIRAAIDRLAQRDVERILFELSDPRRWAALVLRRCGFLPRGRATAIRVAPLATWMSDSVRDIRSWYLTFGDTDHD